MKKIFLLVLILSLGLIGKAQWPIIQNLASDSTLISVGRNFGGGIKGNLINTSYSDTTAANLQRIRQYAGGQIFTTGDTSIWLRSIGANKWVKLAGSAGATNIYNTSSTLTGNRTVSGNNLYNIAFDAVTTFRAEANAGTGKISSALVSTDSIFFQPNEGVFIIDSLASGASTDSVLVWTQATGRVKKRSYSSFTPTWQQTLTAGSTLTTDNTINSNGYDFAFNGQNIQFSASDGVDLTATLLGNTSNLTVDGSQIVIRNQRTGASSYFDIRSDSLLINPHLGYLVIDTIPNISTQNTLLGWKQGTGQGQVGYVTLGSGLSLSSGVLNTSGTVPTPISSLTAATGTNSIDNGTRVQQWNWNTLANNSGLVLNSTSTTAAGNAQTLLYISSDGTNATSSQTTYGQQINNAHDGTSSTNVGIKVAATNATNNYAIIVPASSGSVGIGTSTPTSLLHVVPVHTTGIGAEFISSTTTSGSIVDITGTSTDVNNGYGLSVNISGTNANSGGTSNGIISQVSNTGISSTNVAAEFVASGATNNYAIIVGAGSGSVGIGTASPNSMLDILPTQTTGVGVNITSSSTTAGSIMNISGTSTALAAGNEGLNIAISGANGTNGITATGARISVTNTNATSGTNVGLDLTASGATTANNALNIAAGAIALNGSAGTSGQVLTSAGASGLPTWTTPTTGTVTGSGTANQVTYWNGSSSITGDAGFTRLTNEINLTQSSAGVDVAFRAKNTSTSGGYTTAAMIVENSSSFGELFKSGTGYVGYKTIAATDLGFYNTGGNISILNDYASGNINFSAGGNSTAAMTINTSNNVGIGTSTPTSLLHVNGVAQIGTAGSTLGQILMSGNTSGTVTLQPAAAAGTWTLTLPDNDGDANQVLTTNGSGVTSWATASGGSPAGNFGNLQINRNGAFATPASDSLDWESATGLGITGSAFATVSLRSPTIIGSTAADGTLTLVGNNAGASNTSSNKNIIMNVGNTPTQAMALYNSGVVHVGSPAYNANIGLNVQLIGNSARAGFSLWANNLSISQNFGYAGIQYSGQYGIEGNGGIQLMGAASAVYMNMTSGGNFFMGGSTTPTGRVHIAAGTASASTAPLKLTTGTSLTTAEAGAFEYTTPQLFFTNGAAIRQEIPQIQQARVSTQYDNTTTTLGTVTGLTTNVAAGKTYRFEAVLYTTSNVAGGVKFAMAGTATATNIIYEAVVIDNNVNAAQTRATALATTVGAVTAVTNAYAKITGTITVNAAGTFLVQAAANAAVGTTSVLVGSTFVITEML